MDNRITKIKELVTVLEEKGFPDGFSQDCGKIEFNDSSKFAYLVDEYDNSFVCFGGKFKKMVCCSDCGDEGFLSDFDDYDLELNLCKNCQKGV